MDASECKFECSRRITQRIAKSPALPWLDHDFGDLRDGRGLAGRGNMLAYWHQDAGHRISALSERRPGKSQWQSCGRTHSQVARLLALAIRFDKLIRDGVIADQTELARLGQVTRRRVTQVMILLQLAPKFRRCCCFYRVSSEAIRHFTRGTCDRLLPCVIGESNARYGGNLFALHSSPGEDKTAQEP